MRVWRVHDDTFAKGAWTGEGARLYGGRWNHAGVPVVYASEHAALAIVEVMAGNLREGDLKHFRLYSADVPDICVTDLPAGATDRERGGKWLESGVLGCRVPSAAAPGTNILLNPASPDWKRVTFLQPTRIDPRLHKSGRKP
ncbi:MAG TPA: RES family NAD+ phosphorylase [Candidatus Thermoplasmatota archaeon]|nr:RES family NAD+ phosphorylase [Candidatus Thermoplasmatota archaeon]